MIHPPAAIIPPAFASHARHSVQRVQRGISPVELVYTDHERWPFCPAQTTHTRPTLHISVLDASFNPPTLAHLALANSVPPSPTGSYDARMLLLSVRNADKDLKPGDATFVQRLEMMRLLSYNVHSPAITEPTDESPKTCGNVAVAVIDEPTFVGKSAVLLRFLQARLATLSMSDYMSDNRHKPLCPLLSPRLTFLLGFDTLVRLFSSRYYPSEQAMVQMLGTFLSPDQEDCQIVCAYRADASNNNSLEVAREFISNGRIVFIDIGPEEQTYSSTEVRAKVAAGDERWKRLVTEEITHYIIRQGIYMGTMTKQA